MGKTAGINVAVYNGANKVAYQRGASLTINGEVVDTTTKDESIWRTILPTWNNAEIQISGLSDINGSTHEAVFTAISTQAALTLNFALTTAGVAGSRFSGSFYITNYQPVSGSDHEGVAEFSITGQLNGTLTYTKV
jgi:TP901-1 family phage major tail protein